MMTELQQRLYTVLKNIGGEADAAKLQNRGSIPKAVQVIDIQLQLMTKDGLLTNDHGKYRVRERVAAKVNGSKKTGAQQKPKGYTRNRVREMRLIDPAITVADMAQELEVTEPAIHHHLKAISKEVERVDRVKEKQSRAAVEIAGDGGAVITVDGLPEGRTGECVVLDAVHRLKEKLEAPATRNGVNTVKDYQTKYDMLLALAEITEESISEKLIEVQEDLAYLHSLSVEPPQEGA